MFHSIDIYPARPRRWTGMARLTGVLSLLLPVVSLAQSTVPTYTITTIVGTPPAAGATPTGGYTGDSGPATSATINGPSGVFIDSKGNIYIADQGNNAIRKVSGGTISTVAGLLNTSSASPTAAGYAGDGGPATSAQINFPDSVAVDGSGNLYFSDVLNGAVRKVNTSNVISSVAGSPTEGLSLGDGGPATSASLNHPSGVAVDSSGNVYIADSRNFRIREVTVSNSYIQTVIGSGNEGFSNGSGSATSANLDGTRQIALDGNGNLYFADSLNNQIRKVALATGTISLVAGLASGPPGNFGFSGDGGLATNATLAHPTGVAVDAGGNVYICDTDNNRIRIVTPDGNINTIAGSALLPGYGGDGGPALSALFNEPVSITVDSSGNLYVADYRNDLIRKLVPSSGPGGPGPAPAIRTANGVISASGFGALPAIAPGTWIEIYGTNLAPTTRNWVTSGPNSDFTGINAPTQLNRTSVSVGGQSAFVEYISSVQVNAQVPGGVALGNQAVTVSTPAGTSAAYNVTVNLQQPALYAPPVFKILGQQCVGALFGDLTTYVFPTNSFSGINSRPAKAGDTIVLYGIGFGQVPGNPPGQIPQAANGLTLPIQPKFFFNGVQAQVSYAGLAPGFIGEYQFNVIVPPITVPAGQGCTVPLTFSVNINGSDVPGAQTLYTSVQN